MGYDPSAITDDLPDPVDRAALDGIAYIPVTSSGDISYIQSGKKNGTTVGATTITVTLGVDETGAGTATPPTPGNLVSIWVAQRDAGAAATYSVPGFTVVARADSNSPGSWPLVKLERVAQIGDGASYVVTSTAAGYLQAVIVESSGATDQDQEVTVNATTGAPTTSITPAGAAATILFSGVLVRTDSDVAFTPATGMTEIADLNTGSGVGADDGPQIAINYRIEASPSGSYTVGSTGGGGSAKGVIAVNYIASVGMVFSVEAPLSIDGSASTFEYVRDRITDEWFWRCDLGDAYIIGSAEIRLGIETAGAKTLTIEGANEADFSDAVALYSASITATGSLTAQDVSAIWSGTTTYRYYQLLLSGTDDVNVHEVSLFDPASNAELEGHLTDPSDAHDASAISFSPTGTIAATNVQDAIAEVASEAGGGGGDDNYDLNEVLASQLVNATSTGDAGSRADHFLGTSLGVAWSSEATALTQGPTVKNSSFGARIGGATANHHLRAYTPSGAFRVEVRVRRAGSTASGFGIGILIRDSGTGDASGNGILFTENQGNYQLYSLDTGTYTSRQTITVATAERDWVYLALARDGSNTWTGYVSLDRALWFASATHAKTFTVAKGGFRMANVGLYAIDFFDVVS